MSKKQQGTRQSLQNLRNIGIIAHVDAGKTTTTERVMFYTGQKHFIGDVDDGNTTTDTMEQEQKRGITIQSAAVFCKWVSSSGLAIDINVIDTPGHVDFSAEVERSMRVLDGAIILVCAKGGVQPQTRTVWRQANKHHVPRLIFVNKMDTLGANHSKVIGKIREELGRNIAVLQLPVGESSTFTGVVDLLTRRMLTWDESDDTGRTFGESDVPEQMTEQVELARADLVAAICETDDKLTEMFCDGIEPDVEQLKAALRAATVGMKLVPVLCGSAFKKKGVQPLLDAVADYLPSPLDVPAVKGKTLKGEETTRETSDDADLAALAFKIVANPHGDLCFVRVYSGVLTAGERLYNPRLGRRQLAARIVRLQGAQQIPVEALHAGDIGAVMGFKETVTGDTLCPESSPLVLESITFPEPVISYSIEAEDRESQQKLPAALEMLKRSDPSFHCWVDSETNQAIIAGLGELHLEIKKDLLLEAGVNVVLGRPQVSFRETVSGSAEYTHTFKKQTGGHGMFAQVILRIEPFAEGEFEFVDAVVGGDVPREFISSVEKGIKEALKSGPLGRYPVVGVRVSLLGGKAHDVDSSDTAFKVAAAEGFKEVFLRARPVLMEPMMSMEVVVPSKYVGGVGGDICQRRGEQTGTDVDGEFRIIKAKVPLVNTFGYSTSLRNATQGTGHFTMEFCGYAPAPAREVEKLKKS